MTSADWAALAQAQQEGGTAYLTALNQQQQQINAQQQQELAGIPGAPGQPLNFSNATGASTAQGIGQDTLSQIQANYPTISWMLNIPELAPQIISWAQQGFSAQQADAAFQSTIWYQQHGDAVRSWIAEVSQDPAQASADIAAQASTVAATLAALGVPATAQQIQEFATQSLAFKWSDQQIKDQIAQGLTPTGGAGQMLWNYGGQTVVTGPGPGGSEIGTLEATQQSIRAEAAKFLVPVSQSTIDNFAIRLAQGQMDNSAVTAYMQSQAESLYPSIKGAIASGIDPATYVTPYKEVAAQLLGVPPDSIDMTQSKWSRALSAPGPGGVPTAMSLYDWQGLLMKDPQYNYNNSVNAKDRASSIAQGLGEMFGRVSGGPAGSTAFTAAGAPRIAGVPIT
jgi:hypothetical protein